MSSFSDKSGQCRGSAKDGAIQVWLKGMSKKDFCAHTTIGAIDEMLRVYGNSNWVLWQIAREIIDEATERWIEGTKDPALKDKRRDINENDPTFSKWGVLHSQQIDSAARVLRGLYYAETGHAPQSWFERFTKPQAPTGHVNATNIIRT